MRDHSPLTDALSAAIMRAPRAGETAKLHGRYTIECVGPDGKIKWTDAIENTVVTVGKNLALDTLLAGAAYSVTGPFMGLISSTSWSAIVAGDTMASHAGWLEAGNANAPTYSGSRATLAFNAAAAGVKSLSASASFAITGTGTVKGAFIAFGAGASATIDNTSGTLLSAGLFTGGDKPVDNGDVLNVSWSLSM